MFLIPSKNDTKVHTVKILDFYWLAVFKQKLLRLCPERNKKLFNEI